MLHSEPSDTRQVYHALFDNGCKGLTANITAPNFSQWTGSFLKSVKSIMLTTYLTLMNRNFIAWAIASYNPISLYSAPIMKLNPDFTM